VPVGVRGDLRQQRFGAWLAVDEALEAITPQALASRRTTRAIPALTMLPRAEKIMCEYGLAGVWGPGGSVGFELASAVPAVTSSSDLDLVLELDRPELIANRALSLWTALAALPVRVDVLLETPVGAAVLSEYVRVCRGESRSFVLRTPNGPRLVQSA
jgi:phosphoribosyl-dephospho-CoA transferase